MGMTPEQEARLPQYAQRELDNLRRKLAQKKKQYDEAVEAAYGGGDGRVFVGRYGERSVNLKWDMVDFRLGEMVIEVQHKDDRLYVYATGGLYVDTMVIKPVSGNVFEIMVRDR